MPDPSLRLTEVFEWHEASVRWRRFGAGPPLVLCHGTPWSSFVWRKVVRAFEERRSVYVWDMVGYGQSDKPQADVSLASQGRLLAALVDHWGIENPDVVAHDIGGAVALRAHLLHGVDYRCIVLIDVVALRPWGSPFFRLVAEHADTFTSLPPNLHEALVREYIRGASNSQLDPDVLDELVAPWTGDGQAAFYRQIAQADEKHTDEIETELARITSPTLIVWGTADEWIPYDRAPRLANSIANSQVRLVEGAGHLIQEDSPGELIEILDQWLTDGPRA